MVARVADVPLGKREDVPKRKLSELLYGNPLYVTATDSILVATMTMLDHSVSWLPVVRSKDDLHPVGFVRGEKIGSRMVEKISAGKSGQANTAS